MTKKGTKKNPAARRLVGKLFAMLAATAALAAAGAALMAGGSIPEEKLGLLAQGITRGQSGVRMDYSGKSGREKTAARSDWAGPVFIGTAAWEPAILRCRL